MAVDYTATYDPTTLIGLIRFVIQDVDVVTNAPASPDELSRAQWSCLFTDQEIQITANMFAGYPNQADLAAADLLENIASNAALLAKHIVLGDYQSDTRQAAKGLRDQADWLRNRAAKAAAAGSEEPAESVTDEVWDDFSYRRYLYAGQVQG